MSSKTGVGCRCGRALGVLSTAYGDEMILTPNAYFVAVAGYEGDSIKVVDSLYVGEDKPVRCDSASI